jgi:hypothetical protein
MDYINLTWKLVRYSLFSLAAWVSLSALALAAKEAPVESSSDGGGVWVMSYMLVGLTFVLGLMVILKSNNRRERAKPEVYVETSLLDNPPDKQKK